jgi:ketosteroid isomerase-like protein
VEQPASENVRALREATEFFNSNLERALEGEDVPMPEVWSPDIVISNFEPSPFPGTYHGHEGLRQWTRDLFTDFTEGRVELLEMVEGDELIAVHMRIDAKGRTSGIPVTLEWGGLFEFQDGQCVKVTADAEWERTLERLRESA